MIIFAPVKDQIASAQVKCFSLLRKNKIMRSSSRSIRIRKIKEKIRWLNSYFFDSILSSRPDGRKFRKPIVTPSKIPKTSKTKSRYSRYVSIRKRRKFRQPKKIYSGPLCAPGGPQVDEMKTVTNSKKADTMTHQENCKPCGQAPLTSGNRKRHNRINELILELRKHGQQVSPTHSRWMIMSKRKMCFVPNNLAIFDYGGVNRNSTTYYTSVLGIRYSKGKCRIGWAKMYPKQTFSSLNIRQLSIDLGQHFAFKRLGISNPRPSIPPGFKLVKIKAQTMAQR